MILISSRVGLLLARAGAVITMALCLLSSFTINHTLPAHPISLTNTFIDVRENAIELEIAIYLEDLALFYWLDADQSFRQSAEGYQRRAIEHADFLLKHLHLLDENGTRLNGRVEEIDTSSLDGAGTIAYDQLMEYTLQYQFVFPLEQVPQYLSIMQDFGGDQPPIPSEMEVEVFLHSVQVEQIMLSHRAMHTVNIEGLLDTGVVGDDLETVQARLRERHTEQLGISSYSKVYHYLYINERGVRHELLIPLLQLEEWLSLPVTRQGGLLEVCEQKALREPIRNFIQRYQRVQMDGGQSLPLSGLEIRFFGPGVRDLATQTESGAVTVHNARVGIIAEYATRKPAQEIAFYWAYYASRYPFFEGWLYAYDEPRESFTLYSGRKPLRWQDADASARIHLMPIASPLPLPHWTLPMLSLGLTVLAFYLTFIAWRRDRSACMRRLSILLALLFIFAAWLVRDRVHWHTLKPFQQAADPSEDQVATLTANLLQNVYAAFSFADEDTIYETLAESVSGPLLRSLYLDIRRSILNREQGGAIARIHAVALNDVVLQRAAITPGGWPSLQLQCEWTVLGSVEHWGHIHTRKNLHRAVIGLVGSVDGWHMQSFEPLTEERIEESIGVRR